MTRRFNLVTCALVLAAGCATGAAGPPAGSVDRILAAGGGQVITQTVNENTRLVVNAPVDRVWTALLTAYSELEIAPTDMDRSAGVFGNSGFVMPARMRQRPASDYFSCGGTVNGMFGRSGRVQASVQSRISATPDGKTMLVTNVRGNFRSSEGTSTRPVTCDSTGLIEQFLQSELERQFPKS